MKRHRKRKCRHCGEGFKPSAQNARKQCYCSEAACKKASKLAANKRWVVGFNFRIYLACQ